MSAPLRLEPRGQDAAGMEPLLTAAEVARILGVRPKRVYELGIPAVHLSERALRWKPGDVKAWIEQRRGS